MEYNRLFPSSWAWPSLSDALFSVSMSTVLFTLSTIHKRADEMAIASGSDSTVFESEEHIDSLIDFELDYSPQQLPEQE